MQSKKIKKKLSILTNFCSSTINKNFTTKIFKKMVRDTDNSISKEFKKIVQKCWDDFELSSRRTEK